MQNYYQYIVTRATRHVYGIKYSITTVLLKKNDTYYVVTRQSRVVNGFVCIYFEDNSPLAWVVCSIYRKHSKHTSP